MPGKPFPYRVPVGSRYGAPMGRPNVGPPSPDYIRLRCRRVPLDPYDPGGAYWGFGEMLFCAWSADRTVIRYGRARSYLLFEEAVRLEFPQADFL